MGAKGTHFTHKSRTCFFFRGDGFLERATSSISLLMVRPPAGVFAPSGTASRARAYFAGDAPRGVERLVEGGPE